MMANVKRYNCKRHWGDQQKTTKLMLRVYSIADKCNVAAIGRPRVGVDGALTAEQLRHQSGLSAIGTHHPQLYIFVGEMLIRLQIAYVIGDVDHLLPIGRDMGEPSVSVSIEGHLRLLASVGFHAPDLHQTCPNAIEPDVLSVRAVFRAIIESEGVGQLLLFSAAGWDSVDVCSFLVVAKCAICQGLAIGTPAMQIAGTLGCDESRFAAIDGQDIDIRAPASFTVVSSANCKPFPVEREDVVVVAFVHLPGVNQLNFAFAFCAYFINEATRVEVDPSAVARPIGCFYKIIEFLKCLAFACLCVEHFEYACYAALLLSACVGEDDEQEQSKETEQFLHNRVV